MIGQGKGEKTRSPVSEDWYRDGERELRQMRLNVSSAGCNGRFHCAVIEADQASYAGERGATWFAMAAIGNNGLRS